MKQLKYLIIIGLIMYSVSLNAQLVPLGTAGINSSLDGRTGITFESNNLKFNFLSKSQNKGDLLQEKKQNEFQLLYAINPYTMGLRKNPNAKIKKLTANKRTCGLFGYSAYPQINLGFSVLSDYDYSKQINQSSGWGLTLNPSYNLALPYVIIEAGLNGSYYFSSTPSSGKFRFTPTLGLKFDGLLELLESEMELGQQTDELINRMIVDKTSVKYERAGDYEFKTTTTSYHYELEMESRAYYYRTVADFGGLALRRTKGRDVIWSGNTDMFSVGYVGRFKQTGLDVILDFGTKGYSSSLQNPTYTFRPEDTDLAVDETSSEFIAEGKITQVYARYSFDAWQMLMRALFKVGNKGAGDVTVARKTKRGSNKNGAFRVMAGIGLGYALIEKPKFIFDNAQAKKDAWFAANPDILRNAQNDPTRTTSGFLYHAFLSVEFGVIGVEWGFTPLFNAPLTTTGKFSDFTVNYTLPLRRIAKVAKQLKAKRIKVEKIESK
jgi:hypothetical protein